MIQRRHGNDVRKFLELARSQKKAYGKSARLSRADWLVAARDALIAEGKDGLKVERLAKRLEVTRGGFYWHFNDRDDFLNALLQSWEQETNVLFEQALQGNHRDGMSEFLALCRSWVEETVYNPAYDSAVRDWARVSKRAEKAVKRVDQKRIDFIQRIFLDFGYSPEVAFIRARITYFHQVGYYTLGVGETRTERRKLLPLYIEALTGKKVSHADIFPGK